MRVSEIASETGVGLSNPAGRHARGQQVALAVDALVGALSVQVSGPPGSGRTTFLHMVGTRLADRGWRTIPLSGVPTLRDRPAGALATAGLVSAATAQSDDLHSAVGEIVERIGNRATAILIDDADHVDAASWAILRTVQQRLGTPIVESWHLAHDAGAGTHGPGGTGASFDTIAIELTPLPYEEFVSVLDARLEHHLDSSTATRIYAQTDGRPGLAILAVESAVRERRLTVSGDRLSGLGSFWSPTIARPLRTLVEPLDTPDQDLLRVLALLGSTAIETAESLDSDKRLEALERRSLVTIHEHSERPLVAVNPPLLADYLRSTTRPALRRRLLRQIEESAPDAAPAILGVNEEENAVRFVQRVQLRSDLAEAEAEDDWEAERTVEAAVHLTHVLMSSAPTSVARIDSILDRSAHLTAEDGSRAAWLVQAAYNQAYLHQQAPAAVADLRAAAASVGAFEGLLLARAAEIETDLCGPADLSLLRDPGDAALERTVRAATHRSIGYASLVDGRVADATRHLMSARELEGSDDDILWHLGSMTSIARGDTNTVLRDAQMRLIAARSNHEPVSLRAGGAIAAFAALVSGLAAQAEDALAEVSMLGSTIGPPPIAPAASLSTTVMAAMVASRNGDRDAAEGYAAELKARSIPDGPLAGAQRAWVRAQAELSAGETAPAAATMTRAGDLSWERGARLAAAFAYVSALEIDPSPDRYERTKDRIRAVEGDLVGASFRYVAALVEQSPDGLVELGDGFTEECRFSLALACYQHGADLFAEAHRPAEAGVARARFERLEHDLGGSKYEPHRFLSARVELTARELEVARLASTGLTNRQIAEELVLSTRTVESHLHRLMRKLRVERRSQLAEHLEARTAGRL